MDWSDEGLVLSARRHGENATVVNVLAREHGRHAGLVRGGQGRSARGLYQPGNHVSLRWRGRLAEHLGNWSGELIASFAAVAMEDSGRLAALSAMCAILESALPEREPAPGVFADSLTLAAALAAEDTSLVCWPVSYARWELQLLAALGFGLDLSACAATGATDNLVFVSPKTGRSVSAEAGEPYRAKLLVLPPFLKDATIAEPPRPDVQAALRLTGFFLERHVFAPQSRHVPPARTRLVEALA